MPLATIHAIHTIRYRIAGSYYEACNCDAVCPCRKQNGVPGGRSTHGHCDFVLSWRILDGHADETDLSGLTVCMAGSYNDDVEGKPWAVYLYIDDRADDRQFAALGDVFQGKAEGNILFTGNISQVLGIHRAKIELDHTEGSEMIRIGDIASVTVLRPAGFDGRVSCGIPGHDHPGQESISNLMLRNASFDWAYVERCGFATDFDYWN